jgi:hypothetical protein
MSYSVNAVKKKPAVNGTVMSYYILLPSSLLLFSDVSIKINDALVLVIITALEFHRPKGMRLLFVSVLVVLDMI